jgi:hypothetical protein
LKFLGENNLVDGLPSIQHVDALCESCAFRKYHRNVFPKGKARRAQNKLNWCMQTFVGLCELSHLTAESILLSLLMIIAG